MASRGRPVPSPPGLPRDCTPPPPLPRLSSHVAPPTCRGQWGTHEQRLELVSTMRDAAVHIMHTRDGARIACACLRHGDAKDRKAHRPPRARMPLPYPAPPCLSSSPRPRSRYLRPLLPTSCSGCVALAPATCLAARHPYDLVPSQAVLKALKGFVPRAAQDPHAQPEPEP